MANWKWRGPKNKNNRLTKIFSFIGLTNEEMANKIEEELPIKHYLFFLHDEDDLVNKVHSRYPFVDKETVKYIISNIFVALRSLLIMGKIINLMPILTDFKLTFFLRDKKSSFKAHISNINSCRRKYSKQLKEKKKNEEWDRSR